MAYCPVAAAASLAYFRAALGLLPAVPSAINKLNEYSISLDRANEIIKNEPGFIDEANEVMFGLGKNINYYANEGGGRIIRITTDAAGTKIISAGRVSETFVERAIASGRLTSR